MEFQEVLDFAAEDPVRGGHWEDLGLTDLMKVVKLHTTFMAHPSSVRYEEELIEAIATATGEKKDCLCFIEVIVHKDDTSKELLEWGSRVSSADSRPPNPQ